MIVRNAHGGAVALDTLKKSSAAATMGIQALATAANVAVSWGISMLISGLYELSRVSDTVSQKAQDIGVSFNNTKSDIEGYKERISELQNVINDNGSSVEQITNARKSLLSIQDELISKFGDEQSAITLVTDAINGQVGALDTLTRNQWQEKLNEFTSSGFINNAGNFLDGYKDNVDRMIKEYGNYTARIDPSLSFELYYNPDPKYKEFEKLLTERFGVTVSYVDEGNGGVETFLDISGNAKEVYETLLNIQGLSNQFDFSDRFANHLQKLAIAAGDMSHKYSEFWDQYVLYQRVMTNQDSANYFKQLTDAGQTINQARLSGNQEEINAAAEKYSQILSEASANINDEYIVDYFNSMYPELQSIIKEWEFQTTIIPSVDLSWLKGKTEGEIYEMLETEGSQDGEQTFNYLLEKAQEYGICVGESAQQVEKLINLLKLWGIVQADITPPRTGGFGFPGFTAEQSKAIDDYQAKINTLRQALSSLQSGEKPGFTDLVQEFPELLGHSENLELAIKNLMGNSLNELYDTLGKSLPDDVKKDLEDMTSAAANLVPSLSQALSAVQKSYGIFHDFEDAMNSDGLTDSMLSSVGSLSASLNDMVAGFYAGIVSSEELYQALSEHYETDFTNYAKALFAKNQYNESFYTAMGMDSAETINTFKEHYGVDLENCKNYAMAKMRIEAQTLGKIKDGWQKYYNIQTKTFTKEYHELLGRNEQGDEAAGREALEILNKVRSYEKSLKALEDYDPNEMLKEASVSLGKIGSAASSAGKQEKQVTIETIDWIQRKSDALKDQHDLLSSLAEDETASYDKRVDALTQLIAMDKERANTAQRSAQSYREAWIEAIKDLQDQDIARIMVGLSDQEVTSLLEGLPEEDISRILELLHREDITKLMSENLNQQEYSSDDYGKDYANNLKEALNLFDQIKDKQKEALEIEQDSLEHTREQIQLREELIQAQQELTQAQQELLSLELERARARLDRAEASGEAVTKGMYRDMISSSRDLADSYRDQIDDLEEQLSQIDDEDSAQYQSLLAQIAKCEQSIADCERQQEEWNDAIKRIPIDRISKYISMLQNIKQDLQNFLDQQSAMGLEASPEQLQQMMSLSEEEIKKLLEQQEKLKKLLSEYEYGSEKFQQTSQEIQDIDNQISSLIQSQMEYNEAILQMPLDHLKRQSDLLSNTRSDLENHIAEQESGGISKTLEQYQALSSLSRQQLENLAAQKEMLTALLDVYDPDSTKYQEVQDQIQTIEGSISSLVQEQRQWNDQILQIPIDRLQSYGDALSNARSDLENAISQQETQGLGKTLEQYQALHSMSMRQLEALGQQKAVLQSVMEVYDKDSDHYKEAQNQLQGIEDSISSLVQEQIQWNNEILQIPIEKIQDYSNSLSNARTDLENSIAEQEARGAGKTMEQYKAMQSMSMRQLENLSRQKEMLSSLLDVYDKDSSQYTETQGKIQEIENSVSSLVQEQARWNQELLRIPIDKIASQYDALSNARKDLENSLAQQESQGIGKTLEQYQALSSISRQQIQALSQQKEMLTALLDVYDKDSDIYSQTQSEIQDIEDSISSLIQEQIQWNQELTRIPIDKMKEYSDSLDSVKSDLKEFMDTQNARGIGATPDQYQQLNAITLAQLEALKSRKEMLTQLMGQYSQDSDAYKTASQEIREVDSAIQSLTRDQYEWNKAILQLPIDNITDINDQLNRYTSVLGDILSDYDTALSAVNGVLDEQIDKINETREASEKAYEDKMKPIQDELDLLKKQNDERSVQLALEKAAYDLDRAKNQKTTQVIRDGQLQYEADADKLRQAGEAKSQAEYNKITHDLEKQLENLTEERDSLLEGYDIQIEQLEKIREKWSSITEEIKLASDLMKADEIFGTADWKDQILSGNDSGLFDPFQKMYESISAQKEQTEKQIASNERVSQMMQLFAEQYQNGSITYSEAMSRISQLTDAMSGGYSAMEQLSGLMSSDGIKDLSQITGSAAEKVSAAASSLAQYMDMVRENNQSIQDYTSSWAQIQDDIAKRLTDLQTPPVSQDAFREYLEAAKTGKQELDQYIQSWEKVRDSVDDQVSALKSTAETMDQFRQYLEMVRENENELADYVQSWGTIKDSVDRQVEALDNASMSLEEFQKYLEAVKSNQDDLSGYTQTWSAIREDVNRQVDLLESMDKAFSDIQKFIDTVKGNENALEQYTQTWNTVRDGVASQVAALDSTSSAMEQFRKHLEAYQANAEGISAYTSTWEKIKESIASQVEALKKAADSLDGVNKRLTGLSLEELKRRYPGAYERGGLICIPIGGNVEDDGKGWADDKESSRSSKSAAESELRENLVNAFGDAVQDMVSTTAQKASAQSSIPDDGLDSGNAPVMSGYRPVKPGDFPLLDLMYEAMSDNEAQGTMFTDLSHMYEAVSGKNTLAGMIRLSPQPYQPHNNTEVSFNGDIVVQGVQNPDAFAKALYHRIEPAMNQNFSKIFG